MDEIEEMISDYLGRSVYLNAIDYPEDLIIYNGSYVDRESRVFSFTVKEIYRHVSHNITIYIKDKKILNARCDCNYYNYFKSCVHIGSCLHTYQNLLFDISLEDRKLRATKKIFNCFYQEKTLDKHLKKQLNLDIEISFNKNKDNEALINFKIGFDRLYNLNNKLNRFLEDYEENNQEIIFGKNFVWRKEDYFLSKEDENIIMFLKELQEKNRYYYNFQYFSLTGNTLLRFFDCLENKSFTITNYGLVKNISKDNFLNIKLKKDDKYYKLSFSFNDAKFITKDYKYAYKEETLYILPEKIVQILNLLKREKITQLIFKEEDLKLFLGGILPIIKNDIILDESVKDKIVIGNEPDVKIYFDLLDGIIFCNVKFIYNGVEIDYFDVANNVLRDNDYEQKVIDDLLNRGFLVKDKKIYLDEIDKIGNFMENDLLAFSKDYDIYTTTNFKETKIIKNNRISSTFSIGQDNIMRYEFDLGNISSDEIVNVLESIKDKKKYYRLKSGDLLNLDNRDLEEFQDLAAELNISKNELKALEGTIPKYRAIYLDSIKKDKYHIINTNNLFDDLITKFNSYKDENITLTKEEQNILRDYQEIGVKWLYNIYKCGFGGILADEMGLGKSIQLIYLIKQIIKEKKDARILIVTPTALVYNWKNEFDKFGSELRYQVIAENKNIRKLQLENLDTNILITTYGLLRQDKEQYAEVHFELMAIDEAQNIKNVNALMTKATKEIDANCKVALTGTPLENSVLELWSIFDFIMPGYLANRVNFQKKYSVKNDLEDLKKLKNLNKQIKPFILRRRKKDVIKELPDKIENNIFIDLNDAQKKLYVAQLEKTRRELDDIIKNTGFDNGRFKILQLLTKLRQLCIDPKIIYEDYKDGSAKIDNLVSIVKGIIENGHKILLFTSFKTALDIVNLEFIKNNISTYVIDGSVSAKKRVELVDKFNHDETNVFLITLKSGGVGLNLTSADVVIHLDLWWNPQVENQATDRAHRIGQVNKVEVIKLICKGTIEERILQLQEKKKILSDTLIEGEDRDKNILSKLSEKDIKHLLSMDL